MEKIQIKDELQNVVNDQFDKILSIKIGDQTYRIAIRQDQIPKVSHLDYENNSIHIYFSEHPSSSHCEPNVKIFSSENGEISQVKITDVSKLRSYSYRIQLNKQLSKYIQSIPDGNVSETVQKHKKKRIVHALSEFLDSLSNEIRMKGFELK